MSANIQKLAKAFAAIEAEHTAAAELTQKLANERANLLRELKAAREAKSADVQPITEETENG